MVAADIPASALLDALWRAFDYPWQGMGETERALGALGVYERGVNARQIDGVLEAGGRFDDDDAARLEYTRLFIGSFKMEAPPYASYYLDGELQVGGPTTAEVRRIFEQFGLEIGPQEHAPADHLRYLLAFLAQLARRFEETGDEAFAESFADFRDAYVLSWMPPFQRKIEEHARYRYYPMLVSLIVTVLGGETDDE